MAGKKNGHRRHASGRRAPQRRATVILDVSSYAHALETDSPRRGTVSIPAVCRMLGGLGFQVDRIVAALALVPVSTGSESDRQDADRIARANRAWMEEQTRLTTECTFSCVSGATNGSGEIGVDDLVVASALIEADRIARDPRRAGEVILVMTHDGDMDHIAQLAAPTPVFLVGAFNDSSRQRMTKDRVPHLQLSEVLLASCSEKLAIRVETLHTADVDSYSIPAPEPIPMTEVAAVIDAYGIACSAAMVLGMARLPSVGSIRQLMRTHGVSDPASLFVTVPDVAPNHPGGSHLARRRRHAWEERDKELDKLAEALEEDGDPTTIARRAELKTAHIPEDLALRLDRNGPLRAAKRLATQISADLVKLLLESPSSQVIVMTDSPHVTWVQSQLPQLFDNPVIGDRVVRWGVCAAPVVIETRDSGQRLPEARFRVLTEQRLAELVRVGADIGRTARQRLNDLVHGNDADHTAWRVVGYDPEIDGVRLRDVAHPQTEIVVADALRLGDSLIDDDGSLQHGVELRFEPSAPTAMPVAAVSPGGHGTRATPIDSVVVLDRDGSVMHFDLDGNGTSDLSLDLAYDLQPINPHAPAVLGKLTPTPDQPGHWVYVSVADGSPQRAPTIVEIVDVDGDHPLAREVDAPTPSARGRLLPPPNSPRVRVAVGDQVWAVDTASPDEDPEWVTLSSPMASARSDPASTCS